MIFAVWSYMLSPTVIKILWKNYELEKIILKFWHDFKHLAPNWWINDSSLFHVNLLGWICSLSGGLKLVAFSPKFFSTQGDHMSIFIPVISKITYFNILLLLCLQWGQDVICFSFYFLFFFYSLLSQINHFSDTHCTNITSGDNLEKLICVFIQLRPYLQYFWITSLISIHT